jgi:exonuclease V gamma subunit
VAFSAAGAAEAQAYLNELVDGYLLGMSQPLLLLPESGGAWLKACYDAEKDVMLMDEETQQKARSKFLQTYEGNMVVSGEGRYLVSTPVAFAGAGALRRNHCPDAALSVTAISLPSVHTNLNSIKIAQ